MNRLGRDGLRGYLGLRVLWAMVSLVPEGLWKARKADVIWVGFPGHTDVALAALIGKMTGTPVVFDAFISWYDSAVRDRGLFGKKSFTAKLLRGFDYVSCRLADRVVVDTPEHAAFFSRLLKVPPAKMMVLPVGVDENVFRLRTQRELGKRRGHPARATRQRVPVQDAPGGSPVPVRVLQYAEYTPLHGGMHVLEAAAALHARGVAVTFELIGDRGPWFTKMRERAEAMHLPNVTLSGYVPEAVLVDKLLAADLVLGIFGDTPKARRVVPNKVVQGLAMRRCVITAMTEAVRTALVPEYEVATCPAGDSQALADVIESLAADPARRDAIAAAGHQRFLGEMSGQAISRHLDTKLKGELRRQARLAARRERKRLAQANG